MNSVILIVEDDDNDRVFETLAFEDIGLSQSLRFAVDGHEAIDYIDGNGPFQNRHRFPLPSLVLLDLNLPTLPGIEVLRWIRSQPHFNSTIVIPLTSSNSPFDIEAT